MHCTHCQKTIPRVGYCCDKAELETLRTVTDEAIRLLSAEVASDDKSIAGADVDVVTHARDRLWTVRMGAVI